MSRLFYSRFRWIIAFFLTLLLTINFSSSSFSSPNQIGSQLDKAQTLIDQGNFNRAASLLESVQPKLDENSVPYFKAITGNLFLIGLWIKNSG